MSKALLLVDIQNDYFEGGRNQLFNTEHAAAQAAKVLGYFRDKQLPIFHVQHIFLMEGAPFFSPNTKGCEIYRGVAPKQGEPVIVKNAVDCFFQTDLHEKLSVSGIKELYICGMMSHMCIDSAVRSAQQHGYSVILIEDACTTMDLVWKSETIPASTVHNAYMASLNGMFAEVIDTAAFMSKMG